MYCSGPQLYSEGNAVRTQLYMNIHVHTGRRVIIQTYVHVHTHSIYTYMYIHS